MNYFAENWRAALVNGYPVIPVKAGMKAPAVKGWREGEITPARCRQWANGHDQSVGIRTGPVVAIDLDIWDKPVAVELVRRIERRFGKTLKRVGRLPKCLLVYRTEEPFTKLSSSKYVDSEGRDAQIEILATGQQFVADGVHPDTGKPYRWVDGKSYRDVALDTLPAITRDDAVWITGLIDKVARGEGWKLKKKVITPIAIDDDDLHGDGEPLADIDDDRLAEIVMAIPNDDRFKIRGDWIEFGMAIHHQTRGSEFGRGLFEEWSYQQPQNDGAVDDAWNSFGDDYPGRPITARLIVKIYNEIHRKPSPDYDSVFDDLPPIGKIELRRGGGFTMRKIEWVWPGHLARGKFHILAGEKGAGKSTIAFNLAATISVGGLWPDGTRAPLGDVLIWSGEDDIEDTILPRIAAAGGNIDRIHFPGRVKEKDGERRFDPATDIPLLIDAARALPQLVMVTIDPVVSASKADSHKNAETRRGLQPLVDFAEERNAVLLGITHFTKNTQGKSPIERVTGTLAYGALPRIVMGAAKSRDEEGVRRLIRIASNIGKSGGGFEYLLQQERVPGHDFTAQVVEWGKYLTGDPKALLDAVESPESQKLKAIIWLGDLIDEAGKDGIPVNDVKKAAEANGFSWRTVERAKDAMGDKIKAVKGKGEKAGWYWVIDGHGYDDDL
jgi:putative DNA primase/helicase